MDIVYKRKEFVILENKKGYVIKNLKGNKSNQVHLSNFNASKKAIGEVIGKKIPRSNSFYYLDCLLRLSLDIEYKKHIQEFICTKRNKDKQRYRNKRR